MPCSKTKVSRGCASAASCKSQKCKLVKEYEYKKVPCRVSCNPGKCQSKCTFTFKCVKILKAIRRVPCGSSCKSPCKSPCKSSCNTPCDSDGATISALDCCT